VATAGVGSLLGRSARVAAGGCDIPIRDGLPCIDCHAHIGDGISVGQAVTIAKQRRMKFGLLQHAGVSGRGYAVTNDAELESWIRELDHQPVFKGIEGEGLDWMTAFSRTALARLDYVQTDPFAVPDNAGVPLRILRPDFRPDNADMFMDRYVDHHLLLIETHPIDILAVPTVLPVSLRAQYDTLWTERRAQTIIDALLKFEVALEIDSCFRVPSFRFLRLAQSAGVTFAFGSNYQTADRLGDISYCRDMYRRLKLRIEQIFCPNASRRKRAERPM
jgi:hypothetical protein